MIFPDIDDCDSRPCQNGGTCTDLVDDYSCACVVGYVGISCETGTNHDLNNYYNHTTILSRGWATASTCRLPGYSGLILKKSRCLALCYPVCIGCITLFWLFSVCCVLPHVYVAFSGFISAHSSCRLGSCRQPSLLSLRCPSSVPIGYFNRTVILT